MSEVTFADFQEKYLPFYTGPQVTIQIGDTHTAPTYTVSKALLTRNSPYFKAMFDGHFHEGRTQSALLVEYPGVLSPHSFEMLLQFFYTGHVGLPATLAPTSGISAIIEFVRLADMTNLEDKAQMAALEIKMAGNIREIIMRGSADVRQIGYPRPLDLNSYCVTSEHIASAVLLRRGHPVRMVLADAAVEGYLTCGERGHKFSKEAEGCAEFALDLLDRVRAAMVTIKSTNSGTKFRDPLSGAEVFLMK